jgi:hypothetical protein
MKRLRRHPLFLAVIALALPLGVVFLSYDFYDDSDFACRTQISIADNEDLLNFLRKMPRVFAAWDEPFQASCQHLSESTPPRSVHPAATAQTGSILRC